MSIILDGKKTAEEILSTVSSRVLELERKPQLVILTVGEDPASAIYVRNKLRACERVGIDAVNIRFSAETDKNSIIEKICELNKDTAVTGIMLQLPIPNIADAREIIDSIEPEKDVDGLTTTQIGRLYSKQTCIQPCTPSGIIELLDKYYTDGIRGKRALVIGRSEIVGKPIAQMLMNRNATVTLCHSKTHKNDLLDAFANAHIVVSATGCCDTISMEDAYQYWKDHLHAFPSSFTTFKGSRVIIDVGMNRDDNGKLCGDFTEEFKQEYSGYYTPVPGGVGPMTVAMLMQNVAR